MLTNLNLRFAQTHADVRVTTNENSENNTEVLCPQTDRSLNYVHKYLAGHLPIRQ